VMGLVIRTIGIARAHVTVTLANIANEPPPVRWRLFGLSCHRKARPAVDETVGRLGGRWRRGRFDHGVIEPAFELDPGHSKHPRLRRVPLALERAV